MKSNTRMNQRYMAAWRKHEISKRDIAQAARDVERHLTHLYVALKYQEKVVEQYNVTAKRLSKFDR